MPKQRTNFKDWKLFQFDITYRNKTRRVGVFTPAPLDMAIMASGKSDDETLVIHKMHPSDEAFQRAIVGKKANRLELQKFFLALSRAYAVSAEFKQSLSLAAGMARTPYFRGVIAGMLHYKTQTATLAELFARFPEAFDPTIVAMVKQAEATSNYSKIFRQIADEMTDSMTLLREVRQALVYPAIVSSFGCVGAMVTNFSILPKITENFKELGFPLPAITRGLIGFNEFTIHNPWVLAIPLGLGIWAWLKRTEIIEHPKMASALIRAPYLGTLLRKIILARALRTLAMLMKNGVWQKTAYSIAADVSNHHEFAAFFLAVSERITHGAAPHEAFLMERWRIGVDGRELADEMKVASITGEPAEVLETVAAVYKVHAMDAAKAFTKVIEPLMIALITMAAGVLIAAIYFPNFYAVSYALKQASGQAAH